MVNSKSSKSKIEETANQIIDFITTRQMLPGDKNANGTCTDG